MGLYFLKFQMGLVLLDVRNSVGRWRRDGSKVVRNNACTFAHWHLFRGRTFLPLRQMTFHCRSRAKVFGRRRPSWTGLKRGTCCLNVRMVIWWTTLEVLGEVWGRVKFEDRRRGVVGAAFLLRRDFQFCLIRMNRPGVGKVAVGNLKSVTYRKRTFWLFRTLRRILCRRMKMEKMAGE